MSEESMNIEEALQVLTKRIETLEYLNLDNNLLRPKYPDLTGEQKEQLKGVKDLAYDFWLMLNDLGVSRELSLAKTYLEETVMWASRHIEK